MNNTADNTFTPGTCRLFIGIGCDKQTRRRIKELTKALKKTLPETRWVPPLNQHLTLAFLGDIAVSGVDSLVNDFDRTYGMQRRFTYRMPRLDRFPDPGGSIVALQGKPEGPILSLYETTKQFLNTKRLKAVRNEFNPHITLGRIRKPQCVRSRIDQPVDIQLEVTKITLYKSTLTPKGSIYTALKETWLG